MNDNKTAFSKKIALLFKRSEFKFFIFFLGLFILSWPFIILLDSKPASYPFLFYFIVWAALILLLLAASLAGGDDVDDKEDD